MKERKIGVSAFPFRKKYYLTRPWTFFKELWVTLKNYWHRAFYGYAWVDLWNLDTYLCEMVSNALDQLADRSHGGPFGGEEWPEFEDWQNELHMLAYLIRTYGNIEEKLVQIYNGWRENKMFDELAHLPQYEVYKELYTDYSNIENRYDRAQTIHDAIQKVILNRMAATFDSWWD